MLSIFNSYVECSNKNMKEPEPKKQLSDGELNIIKGAADLGSCGYHSLGFFDVNRESTKHQTNNPYSNEAEAEQLHQQTQNTLNSFI